MADRKGSGPRRSTLIVAGLAAVIGFVLVVAFMQSRREEPVPRGEAGAAATAQEGGQAPQPSATAPAPRPAPTSHAARDNSTFYSIFGMDDAEAAGPPGEPRDLVRTFAVTTFRLALAALLAAFLAFRPRRFALFYKRNPFVAQTQILLAVVASALMMVVGDSAARAFGIFAAVSLVRFRTNIKDPKEITVLLVSLAIGLATGVGRWELGLILSVFVFVLLWGLEYREPERVYRAMELTVKTKNVDATQEVLLRLFRRYSFDAEMRTIDRPDGEGEVGCISYYVNVSPLVSTDRLSEEIFSSDTGNVDSVEWDQKKSAGLYYQ
jgi:hypothetical protein